MIHVAARQASSSGDNGTSGDDLGGRVCYAGDCRGDRSHAHRRTPVRSPSRCVIVRHGGSGVAGGHSPPPPPPPPPPPVSPARHFGPRGRFFPGGRPSPPPPAPPRPAVPRAT